MNHNLRRNKLAEDLPEKSAVFVSASEIVQQSNDAEYPFSQDRNFWYLTGINKPDCLLMLAPHSPFGDEVLFIPEFSEFENIWLDPQLSEEQASQASGIKKIIRNNEKLSLVREVLGWADNIYTPRAQTKDEISNMLSTNPEPKLRYWLKKYGAKNVEDITPQLTQLRMVKDEDEINEITNAVNVTLRAFDELMPVVAGCYEYELEAKAYAAIKKHNYDWGYSPIIASGADTCVIHSFKHDKKIENNSALLMDIGARKNYYSADITRSMWVGEKNENYEQLHAVVSQLQQFAIDIVKPGKTMADIVKSFRESLLEQLKFLGLLDKNATLRDTLEFMPHGLSHHLGLDIHDAADYYEPLKPGMVITIEPGIYLKDQGVGVRIEDDILVTATGSKVIGA